MAPSEGAWAMSADSVFRVTVETVLWVDVAYLWLVSAYIFVICLAAWMVPSRRSGAPSKSRIAVLVPAHNEEQGIGTTVKDLLASNYPRDAFEIFVIADNCSDGTARAAMAAGAQAFERHDEVKRGKGFALDWALTAQASVLSAFDVVAFVDADMYVDREFLSAINERFADSRIQAVQGRYTVSNPAASPLAAMGYMSFAYVNHVRPAGRSALGGTAELKGSGMAFRRELICSIGWPAASIAEDVDFGKDLLFRGVRVVYAPDAVVTSDIPTTLRQVTVQQSRWEGGKIHVFRKFFGRTLGALVRRPSIALADALLDLLVPPLSVVLVLAALGFVGAWLAGGPPLWSFAVPVLVFALAVLTGLLQLRAPAKVFAYIAFAPVFIAWKLLLLAKIAFAPAETEWKRTPRDAEER